MKHLRFLIVILILIALRPAPASVTQIVNTVYFTNLLNGVTNADFIIINGTTYRYTNGTLNNVLLWIQSTNRVGWAATNTLTTLARSPVPGTEYVGATNTNAVIIAGSVGNMTHTVTLSAGIGTNTYVTNVYGDYLGVGSPLESLPTPAARTNIGSRVALLISNGYGTNVVSTITDGARMMSNYVDNETIQSATNKSFFSSTNNGGLLDGTRATNLVSISGSNGTYADLNLQRGSHLNATNLSGTNVNFTNVFLRHVTFKDAQISGTNIGVTNGFTMSVTNINPVNSNTVNYGNALRSEGSGGNSLQVGSNALSAGITSLAVGNNAYAQGQNSVAVGISATATNATATAVGASSVGTGEESAAFGGFAFATNSATAIGARSIASAYGAIAIGISESTAPHSISIAPDGASSALYAVSLGYAAVATHSNSAAIGPPSHALNVVATTTTNQIRLGTAAHAVSIPGVLSAVGISNLTTIAGSTNILQGDLSFPRSTVTTVANGHNTINIGTNVFVDLTGSPTAAWTWGGITGGNRDGKHIIVRNNTGYACDILDNSGTEPTAALRIDTPTGTNITLNSGGAASFIYDSSASRWVLLNVFNTATPTATATNAVTLGENLGLTNATRMGVFYQVQGQTNIQFRSLQAGSGVVLTNEGTNIVIAATASGVAGEANVNGEVSLTNATMFGLVNGKAGVTNLLRSIAPRYGLNGTNEGGTNISFAIDPAIVAAQADLTTASNALRTTTVNGLTNKVENLNGTATNLTVRSTSGGPSLALLVDTNVIVVTNGMVGIKTTAPAAYLDIAGTVGATGPPLLHAGTNAVNGLTVTTNGVVGFGDGTAAFPGIGWLSDNDGTGTGFYRSAADRIAVAINGALFAQMLAPASGGLSLSAPLTLTAVQNSYFVGGGNVGIGTATPLAQLHVTNTTAARDPLRVHTLTGDGSLFAFGVSSNRLGLFGATAITNTPPAGYAGMFAETNTGVIELAVIDSAGNVTQISPHPRDCPPLFLIVTNWMSGWPEVGKTVKLFNGTVTWKNNSLDTLVQRWNLENLLTSSNFLNTLPAVTKTNLARALCVEETFAQYNARRGLTPGSPGFLVKNEWVTVQNQRQADYNLWRTNELIAYNTPLVFTNNTGQVISNQFNTNIVVRPVLDVREVAPELISHVKP